MSPRIEVGAVRVRLSILRGFFVSSVLVALHVGLSMPQAPRAESVGIKIFPGRVERVSLDEVRYSVKIVNGLQSTIFLPGVNFGRPLPETLSLEQWRTKEGWKTVAPCMDTPPPHVIKLAPGQVIALDYVMDTRFRTICKEHHLELTGRYRYRLDYFDTEKRARAYIRKLFSPTWKEARAPFVVSEPFDIPPFREPAR